MRGDEKRGRIGEGRGGGNENWCERKEWRLDEL